MSRRTNLPSKRRRIQDGLVDAGRSDVGKQSPEAGDLTIRQQTGNRNSQRKNSILAVGTDRVGRRHEIGQFDAEIATFDM